MVKFSTVLFRSDKPNCKGLIYPKKEVEKVKRYIKKNNVGIKIIDDYTEEVMEELDKVPFNDEIKRVNPELNEENVLSINFTLNKKSKLYDKLQEGRYISFACGEGEVSEDNIISDYLLKYIVFVPVNTIKGGYNIESEE